MNRKYLAVLLALMMVMAACGGDSEAETTTTAGGQDSDTTASGPDSDDALAQWQEGGIKVGFVGEVPWSYLDDDGNFVGAEAEVATTCANNLGIEEVEPVSVQFDGLLPGLDSGRWDVIAAGMSLRDERLEVAIATQQMYGFGVKVVVEEGNPLGINSWSDIAESGETVGMVAGGNYQESVEALGIPTQVYESLEAELLDFEAGRINIAANAELSLVDYIANNPDSRGEMASPWDYEDIGASQPALYFNQNEVELRDAFNDCITELKNDGTLGEILEKYGFDPDSIPPPGPGQPTS